MIKPQFYRMIIWLILLAGLVVLTNCRCSALPVWPVTMDPNAEPVLEDRIGYEDNSNAEFSYRSDPNIEYRLGDGWGNFPRRLNAQNRAPHTVHILFETNSGVAALNLVMSVNTNAPYSQRLGVFLDGQPLHPAGGEKIQGSSFKKHTLWLGSLARGEHKITISNEEEAAADEPQFGVFFDYLRLIPADKIGFSLTRPSHKDGMDPNAVLDEALNIDPNTVDPPAGLNFYYGCWRLKISGLGKGGKTRVEIHCPADSFFDLEQYYAYDPVQQDWLAVAVKRDTARSMITLELCDGGAYDTNPSPDGSILHIGAIAIPFCLGERYEYKGCFISSL